MKAVSLKSSFDEISALRWRMKPLAALGRVVVYEPHVYGQPATTLIVYEDGTLWSSAIAGKPKNRGFYSNQFEQVSILPHDPEFGGLFCCLVKAGLISKQTSDLVKRAISTYNRIDHPGRIGDHRIKDFEESIRKYGSPAGMKRAKQAYDRLIQKDVKNAITKANKEYAERKAAAARKAEKAAKAAGKRKAVKN